MRGKAVATRLRIGLESVSFIERGILRFSDEQHSSRVKKTGSDVPASRNERAEGHFAQQEMNRLYLSVRASLAGGMRLEVAVRESGHFWRRTDDGRSWCALHAPERPAEVLFCGHYELAVCTEETSADTAKEKQCPHGEQQDARKSCGGPRTAEAVSQARVCCFAADKDFREGTAFVGLAATNPTLLSVSRSKNTNSSATSMPPPHAASVTPSTVSA